MLKHENRSALSSGCRSAADDAPCAPCVAQLSSPADRVAALRTAIADECEPLVTLTHLLHLCRDEHGFLWERVGDADSRTRVAVALAPLEDLVSRAAHSAILEASVRHALGAALEPVDDVPPVVVARALAEFIDDRYADTFSDSFRRRSPYQPSVGDPVPLDSPDLRDVTDAPSTSPPWRLANRLDETRHIRLAGEWAVEFRIVFDYSLTDTLAGLITRDTVVATCHPNRNIREFDLSRRTDHRTFPILPVDPDRQRTEIGRVIARATAAGASIIVLPELCVTEPLAHELQDWVRRPDGPRLLVAGSYHHQDPASPWHRRNTAIAWVRGDDRPLTHDKYSPADRPVVEDIQPSGWPELRVYVTNDGWHIVIAICRDLLNPHAVHALTEAGVNLVLVPAMSESLIAFGGPAAQLVGAGQALVVVANNPSEWSDGDVVAPAPARALFGHPALGQQIRFVRPQDPEPGVALLTIRSAEITWLPSDPPNVGDGNGDLSDGDSGAGCMEPAWVRILAENIRRPAPSEHQGSAPVSLRPAAVLVLLTDGPTGPVVLLSERVADLADYPAQVVFPGGAVEPDDDGPVATALREAREEVGLDPNTVEIVGVLPPLALPETGFLVDAVVAWSGDPKFTCSVNFAEVNSVAEIPLSELAAQSYRVQAINGDDAEPHVHNPKPATIGTMTATVIDVLLGILAREEKRLDASGISDDAVPSDLCLGPDPKAGQAR